MKANLPRYPNSCHTRRSRRSDGTRQNSEEHSDYNYSNNRRRTRNRRESLKVAIVGFGMMGRQIAQVFLQNGHQVTVTDEKLDMLKPGVEEIENGSYGIKAGVSRGKLTEAQAASALRNLHVAQNLQEACKEAGLVVEAVFESLDLKQRLFEQMELAAPSSATLASNTSTLSLARIAEKVRDKERVLGLHFFNPAQATKLVEIVKTDKTSRTRLEEAVNLVKQFGKTS